MQNRSITFDCLAAWACWIVGLFLMVSDAADFMHEDLGFVGVGVMALGHVLTMQRLVRCLERRERVAFELGHEAGVRSIR